MVLRTNVVERKQQYPESQGRSCSVYLVNVRDEFALPWHVHFLIVGSHFALDGKKQHFQVSFFCKSKQNFARELSYNQTFITKVYITKVYIATV